jgi:sortase A
MSRLERWTYRLGRIVNISTILLVAGLMLLVLGGLTFYQQYRPAEPPPELVQAPTALPPTPVPTQPTATLYPTATPYPTYTPYPEVPTPTITPTPERPPADAPPSRIVIPSIGVDSPVIEVGWSVIQNSDGTFTSVWDTADYAVGYHKTSAVPGVLGNCVLSGHNNIKGEVFKDLSEVKEGDMIYLYAEANGEMHEYAYQVESAFIVQEVGASEEQRRQNAQWIAPTSDERVTLVSCWPHWNNTHRVIVVAKPYTAPQQAGDVAGEAPETQDVK